MDETDYTDGEIRDPESDQKRKPPAPKPGMDTTDSQRAKNEALSRNCQHCGGSGWATVYAPDYDGDPIIRDFWQDGTEKRRPGRSVAHCVCPLGRWMRTTHEKSRAAQEVYERTPDFEIVLTGDSFWLAKDPTGPALTLETFEQLPLALQRRIKHMRERERGKP